MLISRICFGRRFGHSRYFLARIESDFQMCRRFGLRALNKLDEFNGRSQWHADVYTEGLRKCAAIETPHVLDDVEHVYYQYCIYVSDPKLAKRRAIRRGVDFETTHVDVCSSLPLFKEFAANCAEAEKTTKALQLPVYSRLRTEDVQRVLKVVKELSADLAPLASHETDNANEESISQTPHAVSAN